MSEVATVEHGHGLVLGSDQDYWNEKQLAALRHMGVENATGGDLAVFHHVCQRTGLDPFARQIHMIGRNTKDQRTNQWVTKFTIQTGIDGLRLIARRASDRLGETLEYEETLWCGADGQWTDVWTKATAPAAAKVTVLRHGKRFPAAAMYREYVQTKRDGNPNAMWSGMPANQLAKCAEALALRKAFPQDLSGVYADEEMGHADRERREPEVVQQGTGAERMQTVLGTTVEHVEPPPDPPPAQPETSGVTSAQLKKIGAAMRDLGITDRSNALVYVADVIGREVSSRNDLSKDEAGRVIDSLERDMEQPFPESTTTKPNQED